MKLKIFLLFIIYNLSFYIVATATIRYVSKTGSSTPPYTSWATASDSIQKCINICQSGDTVYVGNGVYKEQVIMIPSLSLIGSGMDSCMIDTRDFIQSVGTAVIVSDSCLFTGFGVNIYHNSDAGAGIKAESNSLVTLNKATNGITGIYAASNSIVYKNICTGNRIGIDIFNSNAIVRRNILSLYGNNAVGIVVEAFDYNYKPIIDSNYIEAFQLRENSRAIIKSFGTNPTIEHNIIILKTGLNVGTGIGLGGIAVPEDSTILRNNLIIAEDGFQGIYNGGVQNLQLHNNYIAGNYYSWALNVGISNKVKNDVVATENSTIRSWYVQNDFEFKHNNIWGKNISYTGFTPDSTNLFVDPMIVRDYGDIDSLDFHLQKYSPMINAGDPAILDKDSTRSDIGLYGGPFGETYTYLDFAPRPPRNLSAIVDTFSIKVKWNKNTEADTAFYKVYRDTVQDFTADSTKLVASTTDSFFTHAIPHKVNRFVYKITCVDKQGNESIPSLEVVVNLTSINDYPMIINDYVLYQNYPNPFNPSTKIAYKLKEGGYVKLYLYDIKGELIDVLVHQNQEGGYYEIEFTASSKNLASGTYLYQIIVKNENNIPVFTDLGKMILLK